MSRHIKSGKFMKAFKYITALVSVALLFAMSVSFLEQETNYICSGTITKGGVFEENISLNIELKEYGQLKQYFTGNNGKLSYGGSSKTMNSYSNLEFNRNKVSLYSNEDSELGEGSGVFYGTFSTITNEAGFYLDYVGEFEGNCSLI